MTAWTIRIFMPGVRWIASQCLVLVLLQALLAASIATPPPPASAFFGLPNVAQPRLSPDGAKIAFLFPHEGKLALGLFDRKTNEARMIVQGRDESLRGFFWKGNDRLVFYADYQGNESQFIATTDPAGKRVLRIVETQPGEYLQGSAGALLDSLSLAPDYIMVQGIFRPSHWLDTSSTTADVVAAKLNVHNRGLAIHYTYHGSERTRSLVVDNTGTVRLRSRWAITPERAEIVWEHRTANESPWREAARHPDHGYAPDWEPVQFAADNRILHLISREEHDRGALYAYDTGTMERGPAIFVPPDGEISDVILSYDRTKLLGVGYEAERFTYHWLDAERADLQQKLDHTFAGMDVRITSSSADGNVRLVWVGSDREAGVYFVFDATAGSMTTFKRIRDLDPRRMRPMQSVKFQARDGLALHGHLTLPAGAEGRRVPLIINPHGGPFGVRDSWGFNEEVQFLASRGYAVLQVNYRGSGGYGRAFLNRGRQQWGRAMQDDLTDAVRWAIDQGIADPARVAIYGASYGGYAALAGVTHTPELYACAINYVGAADLDITFKNRGDDAFMDSVDARYSFQSQWIGPSKEYRDVTSPVNFVGRIRVPTLHAYGRKDPRVKIDHWTRLEPLLKKYGKPYVSIEEKAQGHGFRDEKASLTFYQAVEEFLARHLAPGREGRVQVGPTEVREMPAKP